MSNEMMPFEFEGNQVRVHIDEAGSPWWVAQDVCRVIGIQNTSDAVMRLETHEKRDLSSIGEIGTALIINESGLYRLIFRSNKPEARRFQNWVFGEVLPSIRKTGTYSIIENPTPKLPSPLSLLEQLDILRQGMNFVEEFELTDDYTRMIARESAQNIMRSAGNQNPSSQLLLPEKSIVSNYFQVEDLRQSVCGSHGISYSQWAEMRGTLGKVIRASIQAADPSAEPIKIKKMVNGAEREVNGWSNGYKDIAIAAVDSYLARQG